jgi:hypothetical protein
LHFNKSIHLEATNENPPSQPWYNRDHSPAPKAFGAGFDDEMKVESREERKKRVDAESALDRQFPLQRSCCFGSFDNMGRVLTACLLLAAFSCARGQDQERNLVDRLLKPDMSLQNTAQNKKFIAANGASINKHATAGTFYVQKKSGSKSFSRTPDFSAWQFNARSFHAGDNPANFSSRKQITNSNRSYSTQTARSLRDAREAGRTVDARIFAGNRPFLDQGKSQRSLDRQNPPLTIEQVRELLNKNK